MASTAVARRSYGTGSLIVRRDRAGRETWHGKWRCNGRQIMRRVGVKRSEGARDGLTRRQAEAELRRLMTDVRATAPVGQRLTVGEVGERYLVHLERKGRKLSTRTAVESTLRVHLVPFFGERGLDAIRHEDVLDLLSKMESTGLGPKSIRNYLGTLSALFNYARAPQRRWASSNPCEGLELPAVPEATEIRFLTLEEVDALVRSTEPGPFEALDRALYRTAAMTGLREGELIALRWRDVDWPAARVRVRQNYVLDEYGTPKSKRSTRSVPMADEVAGELERLFQASSWQGDDDLVFADPVGRYVKGAWMPAGGPLCKAALLRRMRKALVRAGLDEGRVFHDLRHTFGTRMAAAGVAMRTLQEWMGHRDIETTQRYADYAPSGQEADLVAAAFAREDAGPIKAAA